jgi:hypothetical protein
MGMYAKQILPGLSNGLFIIISWGGMEMSPLNAYYTSPQ